MKHLNHGKTGLGLTLVSFSVLKDALGNRYIHFQFK